MRLYKQPATPADKIPDELAAKFENDASRYWDMFYKRNATKFFKDRHYFDKEFPELLQGNLTVLEVGCGVGNTVFPLLEINKEMTVYACDFSPRAVQLVQEHPQYSTGRVTAFVADITKDQLLQQLPGPCVDYCSMVFVLSAVAPEKMPQAIRNVASVLKAGTGRILFRDYAVGDLAQTRLEDGNGVKFIRDNFYVRGDGTCCYYYGEDGLRALFASEGFVCESMVVHAKVIQNRKLDVKMPRRWIQAVLRFAPDEMREADRQAAQQQWQEQQQQQQPSSQPGKRARIEQSNTGNSVRSSGSSSNSSDVDEIACGGRSWQVPAVAADDRSSSSSSSSIGKQLQQAAVEIEQLLACQQQQRPMLGKHLLFLPPWAAVQQQQQQEELQDQQDRQQQLQQVPGFQLWQLSATEIPMQFTHSCNNSNAYVDGAVAALFALVVVWLGARRSHVLVPGSGSYAAGLSDMLHLNESRVVCERIRLRKCDYGDNRQLQKLQIELNGQQLDMLVGRCWVEAEPSAPQREAVAGDAGLRELQSLISCVIKC